MPAKNVEVRKIEVSCPELDAITGEQAQITSCRLECQANSPARAIVGVTLNEPKNPQQLSIATIKGPAVLRDLLYHSQVFQTQLFKKQGSTATLTVINRKIDGTELDRVVISGLLSSPTFRISAGNLVATYSILSEDTLMEGFNPSIYRTIHHTHGGASGKSPDLHVAYSTKLFEDKTPYIYKHIQELLKLTVDDTENIFKNELLNAPGTTPDEKNNKQVIQENAMAANHDVKDIIEGLLRRSGSTPGQTGQFITWNGDPADEELNLFEHPDSPREALLDMNVYTQWMVNEYTSSRNFYNFLMQTICPNFMFDYICPFSSNTAPASRIQHSKVNRQTHALPEVSVPFLKSISLNLASSYQRPLGQVIVYGSSAEMHGDGSGEYSPVGAWPNPIDPIGGKVLNQTAPSWWSPNIQSEQGLIDTPRTADGILRNGRQIQQNSNQKSTAIQTINKNAALSGQNQNFLELWARKQYGGMALQHTSANIIMPLDLRWGSELTGMTRTIGERIKVRNDDITQIGSTEPLFSGFLQSVVHEINLESGGNYGVSETHLEFNYIKMPDTELPGDMMAPAT
jgi:hypothetical protein